MMIFFGFFISFVVGDVLLRPIIYVPFSAEGKFFYSGNGPSTAQSLENSNGQILRPSSALRDFAWYNKKTKKPEKKPIFF